LDLICPVLEGLVIAKKAIYYLPLLEANRGSLPLLLKPGALLHNVE
jgi:hypothetical protein